MPAAGPCLAGHARPGHADRISGGFFLTRPRYIKQHSGVSAPVRLLPLENNMHVAASDGAEDAGQRQNAPSIMHWRLCSLRASEDPKERATTSMEESAEVPFPCKQESSPAACLHLHRKVPFCQVSRPEWSAPAAPESLFYVQFTLGPVQSAHFLASVCTSLRAGQTTRYVSYLLGRLHAVSP